MKFIASYNIKRGVFYEKRKKTTIKLNKFVKEYEIEKQERLVELLAKKDVLVTQATVSRDIRELNVTKVPSQEGLMIYKIFSEEHLQTDIKLKKKITRGCCEKLIV